MQDLLATVKRLSLLKTHQALPEYRRFLFQDLLASRAKITGLYGARGVGKTTLMLQVLASSGYAPDETLYISCDHPALSETSLFDLVDTFVKWGGKFLVVDEIHEAKNFQQELKAIYDFLDVKILFSGSSAISITHPDFARRFSMYHLPAFSLREYLELTQHAALPAYPLEEILHDHEAIVHAILAKLPGKKILKHYADYLRHGAYPFYFEDPAKYTDRLTDTINTALHTDLSLIFNIPADKIDTLKKLLMAICVSKPLELSIESLSKTVGITKTTLYKYIDYLAKAELIRHISHEAKRFRAIRKPDKLYLASPNLFEAICLESDTGTLRETFFASQLSHHHTLHYPDKGDFLPDERYTMEIGGSKKRYTQIENLPDSYIAADDIEIGTRNKIPLWLFGFLY